LRSLEVAAPVFVDFDHSRLLDSEVDGKTLERVKWICSSDESPTSVLATLWLPEPLLRSPDI
jgi:hypothetical protein